MILSQCLEKFVLIIYARLTKLFDPIKTLRCILYVLCYYLLTKDFTATDIIQTINNTKYTKLGPLYNPIKKKSSKPAQPELFLEGLYDGGVRCQIEFNQEEAMVAFGGQNNDRDSEN